MQSNIRYQRAPQFSLQGGPGIFSYATGSDGWLATSQSNTTQLPTQKTSQSSGIRLLFCVSSLGLFLGAAITLTEAIWDDCSAE